MNILIKYRDVLGMYHDKPCEKGEPSSNNAWIYTAYAKAVGLVIPEFHQLHKFAYRCYDRHAETGFYWHRRPGLINPPISRDEIIGMNSLLPNTVFSLIHRNWFLYDQDILKKFSYLEAFKSLWRARNEHRNYIWKNHEIAAYKIAFRVLWHDRYYLKKCSKMKPNVFETLCFYFYMIHSVIFANPGNKNLLWLQLHDMKSKYWIRLINRKKNFAEYFGGEHVFNQTVLSILKSDFISSDYHH